MSDLEALMWVYSTIAQTLGAIVAVVGMLTVYKLDRVGNSIERIFNGIREFLDRHGFGNIRNQLYTMGPKEWQKNYKTTYSKNLKDNPELNTLKA